ncbi:sugar phosphate isomerase/epimerase family protein [Dickeya dadantii]|uniref:sugar phosphate isomerase/epimerase family protein n=1 Tax=Dickeya dadantii TaxID=204038 RepID=UPI00039BB28B|nr:sugar phosphate isomerase/epimerase [Dickeya dadantii]NPE52686.1 sugar phosphate isomerase/epimerase [Dickeya dadantii]OOC14489.1 xylose isomerase [Dickeya dadantii]
MDLKRFLRLSLFISLFTLNALPLLARANLEAGKGNVPIALQMYTLRHVGSLEEQFAMANKAGFNAVELVGDHNVSSDEMKSLLEKYNLKAISAHVQLTNLRQDMQSVVAFNNAVGNRVLIVPWIEPADRPASAQAWKDMAQELDNLARHLKKQGMTLGYHNHDFEMKKYNGKTALEILFDHAPNLAIELDMAWVTRGGQDPARLLKKYKGRVFAVHAKDHAPIGTRDDEMNFAPAGEGILTWDDIFPAAEKAGKVWFIVEHDAPKDPYSIITTARKFLLKHVNP